MSEKNTPARVSKVQEDVKTPVRVTEAAKNSKCDCGKPVHVKVRGLCKPCYQREMDQRRQRDHKGGREFCPSSEYRDLLSPETRARLESLEKKNARR